MLTVVMLSPSIADRFKTPAADSPPYRTRKGWRRGEEDRNLLAPYGTDLGDLADAADSLLSQKFPECPRAKVSSAVFRSSLATNRLAKIGECHCRSMSAGGLA